MFSINHAFSINNSYLNDDEINAFLDIVKLHTSCISQNVLFYQIFLMYYSAVENANYFQIVYEVLLRMMILDIGYVYNIIVLKLSA